MSTTTFYGKDYWASGDYELRESAREWHRKKRVEIWSKLRPEHAALRAQIRKVMRVRGPAK